MACEACIRGHRVSGCNHHDRKLLPIAKKGRPVSQCNHCRHMRKSRSAHVKCDCGERFALLKEQAKNGVKAISSAKEGKGGKIGKGSFTVAGTSLSENNNSKSVQIPCSCGHGGRCTCALKKEPPHLDAVPEFSAPLSSCGSVLEPRTKPRLQMTHSESSLTTFANGHHKPTHKHHGSTHGTCPYSIPVVGHTGHTFGERNGCTKTSSSVPSSASAQKIRRIKSEKSSPDLRTYPGDSIAPLELTPRPSLPIKSSSTRGRIQAALSVDTNHPSLSTMHDFSSQELLPSSDSESYQFSAGLYTPNSAGWPPSFSQYDSSTSYDEQLSSRMDLETYLRLNAPPALTNSTSGDERDDIGPFGGPSPPYGLRNGSESSDHTDSDQYHLSTTSSYVGLPQGGQRHVGNKPYDGIEFDRLLVSRLPISTTSGSLDSFESGLAANDGIFDAGDLGLGSYGSATSFSENSPEHIIGSSKPMGSPSSLVVSPSSINPTPDESDYLWMAPWSGGAP